MKVRIIIEYEPDVDHENISDEEMRAVAYNELQDWREGNVTIADFVSIDDPATMFAVTVEFER